MTDERTPAALCWHCDRLLDAASGLEDEESRPEPGSISLCLYCGAVAVFGPDLMLQPPTKDLLDDLGDNQEFGKQYTKFSWARQYVMINASLLRGAHSDPDQ